MDVPPFELERFFAEYEHEADIMLAESGIRSLAADRFDLDPGRLGYVIPTNGDPELRARIGERYGRSRDEVLLTVGTQEANYTLYRSLLNRDDHAVVVTPTYQALHTVSETIASVTRVNLEPPDWTLDVDAVADAVRPETTLIVFNNPNNPTGRYHDPETVTALYDIAADNDAFLHADEVYRLLDPDPNPPVASLGPHGISTAGLTKAYGLAGLRFGWLAGPEHVVEAAWEWKDYTTISPSKIGQHVAKQALGEQEAGILSENQTLAKRNREIVRSFLEEQGLSWYDPVGVNGFVEVPPGFAGSESFCRAFVEEQSVVLAPGAAFGFDEYFRIGFGLPTTELKDGLSRLRSFLN
ncbi:aminotransferase class I/II-fold pyridoxal phosphate-dependent enzyme [Halodesulfurarchaeum sp.]|uniref:aminotransferase class I/II-fold pyridoxal phosphate-dependent enzyme n=1 Tax=Halodesulfurarchaeum sp. TaxID=1980530 RepID=UPI002FC2984A